MATVILAHWREGLQKVSLANLQRELLHLSLKEAKENVDQLLDGKPVVLRMSDDITAGKFYIMAWRLGAVGRLIATHVAAANRAPINYASTWLPFG